MVFVIGRINLRMLDTDGNVAANAIGADMETISTRPMLFITGDKAHSKKFSEDAYKRAAEPRELYHSECRSRGSV